MIERALRGGTRYWTLVGLLAAVAALGGLAYLHQLRVGLGVTGMSRDVTWGLYIAQFTFLVGVAASAVMVVLPYYLHGFKPFGRVAVLGECLAVGAVTMCLLFILADLGQPYRALNMILHPSPRSILFWDMIVLNGYLLINAVAARMGLRAEESGEPAPRWVHWLVLLSIPWAFSIHTVTAFIYQGLAARPFWLSAVMAPRFLASAFCSGPALLLLLCLLVGKVSRFRIADEAVDRLSVIITYALLANIFLLGMELFTALYGAIPEHTVHFRYLFLGLDGHRELVPFMWASVLLCLAAAAILLRPAWRRDRRILAWAAGMIFLGTWLEKGWAMVVAGFVPSPTGAVTTYVPTGTELLIALGIYATGALIVTMLYRAALVTRGELPVREIP